MTIGRGAARFSISYSPPRTTGFRLLQYVLQFEMLTKGAAELVDAMHRHEFIRFSRRFESSKIRGYVLDVGPQFFLFALVSDRIYGSMASSAFASAMSGT